MIRIKESTHMKDVTPAELSKAEAKKLTLKIKAAVDDLWSLLVQAHEGKAWKALGHPTWEVYVKAEFGMSRQRSYQLLDKGEVVHAIAEVAGENVKRVGQISARDVDAVKDDLPAVTVEIESKIAAGEEPEKAVAETIAAARAEKEKAKAEKAAKQAEHDRQREEHAAALPQAIKDREQAKKEWRSKADAGKAAEQLQDRVVELEETVRVLETENEALKTENKKFEAMRVQFDQGGFEKVIAGKDEEIRVLLTRVEGESRDKVAWANKAKFWKDEAIKLGWTNGDFTIDIETGEIADA